MQFVVNLDNAYMASLTAALRKWFSDGRQTKANNLHWLLSDNVLIYYMQPSSPRQIHCLVEHFLLVNISYRIYIIWTTSRNNKMNHSKNNKICYMMNKTKTLMKYVYPEGRKHIHRHYHHQLISPHSSECIKIVLF